MDERTYLDLVGASGSPAALADGGPKVSMRLANENDYTHVGKVNFVDNQLNGNTGTIRLRGEFANPNRTLKAGLFVRIRLPVGKPYPAVLIPDEALQSDQGQKTSTSSTSTTRSSTGGSNSGRPSVEIQRVIKKEASA